MDRTERFYKINELLKSRRAVPREVFLDALEISPATFKRDLEYLRDRMGAPIIWDRELNGYRFESSSSDKAFELPGLWFNDSEIHALFVMEALLEKLEPGLLRPHIEPLKTHIRTLLSSTDHALDEVYKRIRILPMASRYYRLPTFEALSLALLTRKRVKMVHYRRQTGDRIEREVSPQRLVHYRDNWYLDTWCHLRNDLRTFSVDAISAAEILNLKAKPVSDKKLDDVLASGYGIFSGKATKKAILRFSAERARWVSREIWHPEQESSFDENGCYVLKIPYSDERELIMDILKYGPDLEVLGPKTLKTSVTSRLQAALKVYL